MLNWVKANRKVMNAGKFKKDRVDTFKRLMEMMGECKRVNQYIWSFLLKKHIKMVDGRNISLSLHRHNDVKLKS